MALRLLKRLLGGAQVKRLVKILGLGILFSATVAHADHFDEQARQRRIQAWHEADQARANAFQERGGAQVLANAQARLARLKAHPNVNPAWQRSALAYTEGQIARYERWAAMPVRPAPQPRSIP
jgi:hypothetical protein